MKRSEIRGILQKNPLLAILRNVQLEVIEEYTSCILNGGVSFFEVALNSNHALDEIKLLKKIFGKQVLIGAGTVITSELAGEAVDAGADFLLSPSADVPVLEYCEKHEIALIPGALTPSDVTKCMAYGFYDIKLFPADVMPASYIRSLKGPLSGTEYMAIGGVNRDNIQSFFKAGYLAAGLGSNLLPMEVRKEKDWETGSAYVRMLMEKIREAKEEAV